jgi:hypothetical protein
MKPPRLATSLSLVLACSALIAGLNACGQQESRPFVPASKPLPEGIEISFQYTLFDTNNVLRPYAPALLYVSPPVLDRIAKNSDIRIDLESRLDGRPIPESAIHDLQFGSTTLRDQPYAMIGPAFQPWRLFPRQTGTYTFDLVLQTQTEKWVCPPLVLTIHASEEEAALLAEFEAGGASLFLDHPTGARWSREPEAPSLPYDALADFVKAHPDSYLTDIILQRIRRVHLRDLNSGGPYETGPLVAEDREALATILGCIDPRFEESFASFRKSFEEAGSTTTASEQLRQKMEINNEWLRIATAARAEQETAK